MVVGAGFTGLAIAWRLAELRPGWRIALLEAQRAGFAASGRNSGFAGALSHRDPDVDREAVLRVVRLSRAGVAWLRERVEAHAIACDWSECGRIHAAREPRAQRNLDHLRRMLEAAGESFVEFDRGALADAIGTDHYRAGVHVERTVLLQPAALARGLATHLPANVALYEESPVRELERNAGWHVRAGAGGVEFEFTWGGVMGMALNQGQFFGRLDEGLFASLGYNGSGVALGSGSGLALADHALAAC